MQKEKGYENRRPCYCGFSECMFHDQGTVDDDGMVGIEMCRLGMYEIPENEIKNACLHGYIYGKCPFYVDWVNSLTKNKLTMGGMRNACQVLLKRIKEHPEDFITQFLGVKVNFAEKLILKHLANKALDKKYNDFIANCRKEGEDHDQSK